jgi:hypothetical protein
MDYLVIGLVLLLALLLFYVVIQEIRGAEEKKRREILQRVMEELEANSPMIITDALYEKLRSAMFSILDDEGHPIGCGFFVTPCGVALTAAHSCEYARASGGARREFCASTHRGQEFTLDLVAPKMGALGIAVLRAPASGVLPSGTDYLPLPSVRLSHSQLLGAPVALIHGSIAWSGGAGVNQIARDNGYIVTSSDSMILYNVSSYNGHSGAALLFRSGQLIGLHSEVLNDLEQEYSEKGPSTTAEAVRLDAPEIWGAVQAAQAAPSAASGSGSRRRRPPAPP